MAASDTIDMFADLPAVDQRGRPAMTSYLPDPSKVRAELFALLARAKAAPSTPWSVKDQGFYRLVFPQMANWLPDDEAARLRSEFAAELDRLAAA